MLTYRLAVHFPRGYIAHPYWPEMYQLIQIEKQSGMNRARSLENRRKCLDEWLRQNGMSFADYEELSRRAARPFYRLNCSETSEIVIPQAQVEAMLVATCDTVRAASRPCPKDQVRSRILCSEWRTGKTEQDGVYERFAVVTAGTGKKLSNQRGFRSNPYIADFSAGGTLEIDDSYVKPSVLENALRWAGQNVGIGASRKMGWGRFNLLAFESVEQAVPATAS
jgi:hypothetical protein